jgi:branched-chain amino acid transport system substrate-binding protein
VADASRKARRWHRTPVALAMAMVAAAAVTAAGAGSLRANTTATAGTIKVGFIGPLSGSITQIGKETQDAAQLAVDTVNAQGGVKVAGKRWKVQLVSEDDGGTDVGASVAAAQRLITQDNVAAMVGGIISSSVLAYMPIAQQAHVPFLDTIGKADTIPQTVTSQNLDYVWVVSPGTPDLARTHVQVWKYLVKPERISFLQVNTDATHALQNNFQQQLQAYKLNADTQWLYAEPSVNDFGAYILKMQQFKPDAIWVSLVGNPSYSFARQLAQSGFKGYVLTGDAEYASSNFLSQEGPEAQLNLINSVTFPSPVTKLTLPFYHAYAQKYGVTTAAYYAVQEYDGMLAVFEGMRRSGGLNGKLSHDREAIERGLKKITGGYPFVGLRSKREFFTSIRLGHRMPYSPVVTQIQGTKEVPIWPQEVAKAAKVQFTDPRK